MCATSTWMQTSLANLTVFLMTAFNIFSIFGSMTVCLLCVSNENSYQFAYGTIREHLPPYFLVLTRHLYLPTLLWRLWDRFLTKTNNHDNETIESAWSLVLGVGVICLWNVLRLNYTRMFVTSISSRYSYYSLGSVKSFIRW